MHFNSKDISVQRSVCRNKNGLNYPRKFGETLMKEVKGPVK